MLHSRPNHVHVVLHDDAAAPSRERVGVEVRADHPASLFRSRRPLDQNRRLAKNQ